MKLRLLFTEKCHKNCDYCCNKSYDLSKLQSVEDYSSYEEVLITGGEPLLFIQDLILLINKIRILSKAKIYIYTSFIDIKLFYFWHLVDGFTITLHTQQDANDFKILLYYMSQFEHKNMSIRLTIFEGININYSIPDWISVKHTKPMDNCPLPINEEFKKI